MRKGLLRLSHISTLHYARLVFRSLLLLLTTAAYIYYRVLRGEPFVLLDTKPVILVVVWIVFVFEMVLRFFPSRYESMGCQKQFAKNYRPLSPAAPKTRAEQRRPYATIAVAAAWLLLNAIIGVLYFLQWIDAGILLLIALVFSVCDMICILFFCPFQTWFMKNKCCGSCRIYNWDYAMMFTPLVFVPSFYTWSLLLLALTLLAEWEILVRLHPERFTESTNATLDCVHCQEKLCHHKKSLQKFLRTQAHRLLPHYLTETGGAQMEHSPEADKRAENEQ